MRSFEAVKLRGFRIESSLCPSCWDPDITTTRMTQDKAFLLLCLLFDLWVSAASANEHPVITTGHGKLRGRRISVKGTDQAVDGYFAIPFAKPPVGPLRFSPPEPAEPWTGVRDATTFPLICVQSLELNDNMFNTMNANIPKLEMSEDCLYLNLYVPAGLAKNARLPVMVWIHGGGLVVGGATFYDGSALVAYENVIVVAIQYRLGILGFFSTGDEHARGNWGFLDQVAALQWVQENIASFGGDPDCVTIFGESAGAFSVSAQILSPLSNGLFHRGISESGVSLLTGLFVSNPDVAAHINKLIISASNCKTASSESTVSCMRKKTKEEILAATVKSNVPFTPGVVDGVFLLKSPEELLAGQEYHPVPYMLGLTNDETGWLLPHVFFNLTNKTNGMDKEKARGLLTSSLMGIVPHHVDLYIDEYIARDEPNEVRRGFYEIFADSLFILPAVKAAKYHRESGHPVYFYEFQHIPSVNKDSRPDYVRSDHTDEIAFVFGAPFQNDAVEWPVGITEEEKNLSRKMMNYWANFARKGNPNGDGLHEWPVFDHQEKYLGISLQPKIGKNIKDHRIKFWTEIYPKTVHAVTQEKKKHSEL